MNPKNFSFQGQLAVGAAGVEVAKQVLQDNGHGRITDMQGNKAMQKRGVDLLVSGLGYVEVKTDTHPSKNMYFELDVEGKPGAVDRCTADWWCVVFIQCCTMYLIPMPELSHWLREMYRAAKKKDIHTVGSQAGYAKWTARGMVVPTKELMRALGNKVRVFKWKE